MNKNKLIITYIFSLVLFSSLFWTINQLIWFNDLKLNIALNLFLSWIIFMIVSIFKNLYIIDGLHNNILIQEKKEISWEINIDNTIWQKINWKSNIYLFSIMILSIFWWLTINNLIINLISSLITLIISFLYITKNKLITLNKIKSIKKDIKFIFSNYKSLITFPWILLSVIYLIMEKTFIYYSNNLFYISLIVLSILIWIFLWNIISWKFYKFKWYKFMLFALLLWWVMNIYWEYFKNITYWIILLIISWVLFSINYNILETSFLRLTSDEWKDKIWIILLWIVSSIIFISIIIIMNKIEIFAWTDTVFQLLASITTLIWIVIYKIEWYLD